MTLEKSNLNVVRILNGSIVCRLKSLVPKPRRQRWDCVAPYVNSYPYAPIQHVYDLAFRFSRLKKATELYLGAAVCFYLRYARSITQNIVFSEETSGTVFAISDSNAIKRRIELHFEQQLRFENVL